MKFSKQEKSMKTIHSLENGKRISVVVGSLSLCSFFTGVFIFPDVLMIGAIGLLVSILGYIILNQKIAELRSKAGLSKIEEDLRLFYEHMQTRAKQSLELPTIKRKKEAESQNKINLGWKDLQKNTKKKDKAI